MMSLFDISAEYRAACDKLADLDLDAATVADTLESLGGDLEVKATNIVGFTRSLEALSTAIKAEEVRMGDRRKALDRRVASLKAYVMNCMQLADVKKIEGPRFRLSIRDNPEAVTVFDEAQVPAQYFVTPPPPPPQLDKKAIKADIKAGVDVAGVKLTRGQRLDIA